MSCQYAGLFYFLLSDLAARLSPTPGLNKEKACRLSWLFEKIDAIYFTLILSISSRRVNTENNTSLFPF